MRHLVLLLALGGCSPRAEAPTPDSPVVAKPGAAVHLADPGPLAPGPAKLVLVLDQSADRARVVVRHGPTVLARWSHGTEDEAAPSEPLAAGSRIELPIELPDPPTAALVQVSVRLMRGDASDDRVLAVAVQGGPPVAEAPVRFVDPKGRPAVVAE